MWLSSYIVREKGARKITKMPELQDARCTLLSPIRGEVDSGRQRETGARWSGSASMARLLGEAIADSETLVGQKNMKSEYTQQDPR